MPHPLPLNALRAFEAAARLGSFVRAAEELGVTAAAVGQQVRGLEARLGTTLFHRDQDGLRPTVDAANALPHLRRGFDLLFQGARKLAPEHGRTRLSISVAPTFAMRWLVPRLHRFHERHPATELGFDTAMRYVDVARGEVDLAIRFGPGRYPGLESERLLHEHVLPLCSPQLCHDERGLRSPADLRRFPLLHVQGETKDASWPDWPRWAARHHLEGAWPAQGPRFSQSGMAVESAVQGQGVALCGLSYSLDEIVAGRLVAPFDADGVVETSYAYDMVHAPERAGVSALIDFRRWMRDEARVWRAVAADFLASSARRGARAGVR